MSSNNMKTKENFESINSLQLKKIVKNTNFNDVKKCNITLFDYISLAKIIASFSVVILHNNAYWGFNYINHKNLWIKANIIRCTFYFAVPIFVLCIGATLLNFNERYGISEYIYKRIIKVIVPLFSWTYILYFYRVYFLKNKNKEIASFENIWNLYHKNRSYVIFSSFHIFIKGYMIIPLLSFVEKSKKLKIYSYCFFTLLIIQSLVPYLIWIFNQNLGWPYNINIGYSIFLFAGYIIHNVRFSLLKKIIVYFFGISSLIIHILINKIYALKYKKLIDLPGGYTNILSVLYSCAIFLFIKENSCIIIKFLDRKYVNKIGALTIGPFFMHLPIKDTYLKYFSINQLNLRFILLKFI